MDWSCNLLQLASRLDIFEEPSHPLVQRTNILEQNIIVVDKAGWFGIWLRLVLQHQALPSECGFAIFCYCLEIAVSSQSHTRESNKQKCKGIQTIRRNWDAISLSFLTCAAFRSGYPNHPCVVCSCPALCCHILVQTKYIWHARNVHRQSTCHHVTHMSWL